MPRTIAQSIKFPGVRPEQLFAMYLDSRKHTESTGGKAVLGKKAGDKFTAWDDYITGRNLAIVPKRLIVQSWRGKSWKRSDADSVLVLSFAAVPGGARVDLVHANVPSGDARDLESGWHEFYWKPWRAYLAKRGKK